MSRATPKMREFAERLIDYEAREQYSETKSPAASLVCEKLRPHLATLLGTAGFRSLFSRALALANTKVPWLRAAHVKVDGCLEELDEAATQVEPAEVAEGGVILITELLGLLLAFIGESLTVRMVHEIWPKLSLKDRSEERRVGK